MLSESVLKITTASMSREIFLVNACDGVTTQLTADGMVKGGNAGIRKRCGRNKHFRQPEASVRSHVHSATGHPSYAQPRAPLRNLDEILKYLPDFRDKIKRIRDTRGAAGSIQPYKLTVA